MAGFTALLRHVLGFWVPNGAVRLYRQAAERRAGRDIRVRAAARERRRAAVREQAAGVGSRSFDHYEALRFLDARGLEPHHIRAGSMPLASLELVRRHLDRLDGTRPLLALHVGNFLGVSLAYLADALRSLHSESKVVSIDPNLTHRGIPRTMDTALALLDHFGLEDRVAILTGYSLEKSASNQGELFGGYDPVANWANERACTQQLDLLEKLGGGRFDVCLLDGNHEADYLRREIDYVHRLLRPGGVLVLDDVSVHWPEIQGLFAEVSGDRFREPMTDGRIGILLRA